MGMVWHDPTEILRQVISSSFEYKNSIISEATISILPIDHQENKKGYRKKLKETVLSDDTKIAY